MGRKTTGCAGAVRSIHIRTLAPSLGRPAVEADPVR
jgi:hypothetical protein